jgi:CRISPR-associated protein Cas1
LSIAHRQLVIRREDVPDATVPCEDLGVLLVDHPAVTYTHGVFTALLEAGAAVVLCGPDHHPAGMMLPLSGNTVQTERYRAQIDASVPLKKRLWQTIVESKIRQQAMALDAATGSDGGLGAMAGRVRSGDPDNLEAQAAQRYWPRLLGPAFRRERAGAPPNNMLNYGYMALRAATARALVASGLLPTLGIHHHNRYNAFCLADDMMEPYRPYVDLKVHALGRAGASGDELGREEKRALLDVFNDSVTVGDRRSPLLLALAATSASLAASFAAGAPMLALPGGPPIPGVPAEAGANAGVGDDGPGA